MQLAARLLAILLFASSARAQGVGRDVAVLFQAPSYNLLTKSQTFTDAIWGKTDATITGAVSSAPDGSLTGSKFVEDTATSTHFIFNHTPTRQSSPATLVSSIFAKPAQRNIELFITDSTGANGAFAIIDMSLFSVNSSGTFGAGFTGVSAGIIVAANGWYRPYLTATTTADTFNNINYYLLSGFSNSYLGDGASGIFIWGAQVNNGTYPLKYVNTP